MPLPHATVPMLDLMQVGRLRGGKVGIFACRGAAFRPGAASGLLGAAGVAPAALRDFFSADLVALAAAEARPSHRGYGPGCSSHRTAAGSPCWWPYGHHSYTGIFVGASTRGYRGVVRKVL